MQSISPSRHPCPTLSQAFSCGHVWDQSGALVPLHSNVSESEAGQLYDLVRLLKPRHTVEIGFCQGISAMAILQALEDNGEGEHWVIDPFQSNYGNAGLEMVRRSGLAGRMHFHESFPEEVLPRVDITFQFGFIDASHLFDLTLLDFNLVDKKLDAGGIVGLHDLWMPSLQKVWRYLTTNRRYLPCDSVFKAKGQAANSSLPARTRFKCMLSTLITRLPSADRWLSPEFLNPWETLQVPNLALLRKQCDDGREWTTHHTF